MRNLLTRLGLGIMLVVFLVGSTPPEYIHDLFAHHEDGIDPAVKKGETLLMPGHHHCSYLGFVFAPFVTTEPEYLFFEHVTHRDTWLQSFYYFNYTATHEGISLRGPPSLA